MGDSFGIVKDSSLWINPTYHDANTLRDNSLRIGIVKQSFNDPNTNEIKYIVQVRERNDVVELVCSMMRHFGGVYNYEDFVMRGYRPLDNNNLINNITAKAGDTVLVGQISGQGRNNIIIGSLSHPARRQNMSTNDGPLYISEFNGIEKKIDKDGVYTVTFKGLPINISELEKSSLKQLPPPKYDTKIGGSFYKFHKDGSWTISDNADLLQKINLDKPNGKLEIISGQVSVKMYKASQLLEITNKVTNIKSAEKVTITTQQCQINAKNKAIIKSDKVAIGKEGIELLDQLVQLIDKMGQIIPISPVGPCTPLMGTSQWAAVEQIKSKIKEITGSF